MGNRTPPPRPEEFRFWSEERVRISDTDLNGHVNNVAFGAYCETGRADLMRAVGGTRRERGFGMVLARVSIDYRREVHYPARLRIGGAILGMGRTSFTLEQGLFLDEDCVATAENVFVIIDDATRRPIPIPPEARERFLALAPPRGQGASRTGLGPPGA